MTYHQVALYVAAADTPWHAVRRLMVLMVLATIAIEVGRWVGLPSTLAFVAGYAWGGMIMYAALQQLQGKSGV